MELYGKRLPRRTPVDVLHDGGTQILRRSRAEEQALRRCGVRHIGGGGSDRHPPDGTPLDYGRLPILRGQRVDNEHRQAGLLPHSLVPRRNLHHPDTAQEGQGISQRRDPAHCQHRTMLRNGGAGHVSRFLLRSGSVCDGIHPCRNS